MVIYDAIYRQTLDGAKALRQGLAESVERDLNFSRWCIRARDTKEWARIDGQERYDY